jgi:sulfur-oxidizing protein SoxY
LASHLGHQYRGGWLRTAQAQVDKLTITGLAEARLRSFEEMVRPYVQTQTLTKEAVTLSLPMLADNGHMVPLSLKIDSPMTEEAHITHVYLLSQRNPVPLMAKFVLGPWRWSCRLKHTGYACQATKA